MPLKPNQQQAAQLVAQGKTQKDTAQAVGVTEQTLCQWAKSAEFEALVNELRWESLLSARDQIQTMAHEAATTIRDIMTTGSSEAVRLKAALAVFDLTGMPSFKENLWGWGIGATTADEVEKQRKKESSSISHLLGDLF